MRKICVCGMKYECIAFVFCVLLISRHRTDRQCSFTNLVLETASEWAPGTRPLTFHQSLLNTEENIATRRSSVQAQRRVPTSEKKRPRQEEVYFQKQGSCQYRKNSRDQPCFLSFESVCEYSALKSPLNILYTKSTVS